MIGEEKRLRAEINNLIDQLSNFSLEEDDLKSTIDLYENSLSWKITSPLRKIGNIIRKSD